MKFILISVEFEADGGEAVRREQLARALPPMGKTCHVLSSVWIIQTTITPAEVFRRLTARSATPGETLLSPSDKLIVAPIATPTGNDQPWRAVNAPIAAKCFNMP